MIIHSDDTETRSFCVAPRPGFADDAPFDLCFTPEAMDALLLSVGMCSPESGAKGFGPVEGFGFDVVEFDVQGSHRAGGAIYSPDTIWGEERCRHWLGQSDDAMRVWTGDLHSHPGGFGHPSGKSGPGRGDLGYVEAVFAQNEAMQYFAIPIVTLAQPGCPVWIWPWIVSRNEPHRPLWANLRVCPFSEFPERQFNPAWEASLPSPAIPHVTLEPDFARDKNQATGVSHQLDGDMVVPKSLPDMPCDTAMILITGIFLIGMALTQLISGPRKVQAVNPVPRSPPRLVSVSTAEPEFQPLAGPIRIASIPQTPLEDKIMNSYDIIARLNPNALCGEENGRDVFIEDLPVDDHWYRIEYRCLPSGEGASAWLLSNPWGGNGFSYQESHLRSDGMICIGAHFDPDDSPYSLEYAILRARFWAVGFAYLMENGYEATCDDIPEWQG